MSNKQLNSVEQDSTENNSSLNQPNSRRGFFKKAAIASPILLSVAGKPAWGSTIICSGSISGNVSQFGDDIQGGCSQGRWKTIAETGTKPGSALPNAWPIGATVDGVAFDRTTPFVDVFGVQPVLGDDKTLGEVGSTNTQGNGRAKTELFMIAYCLNWFTFAPIIIAQNASLANYHWPSIEALKADYLATVNHAIGSYSFPQLTTLLEDSWRNHQ